MQQLPTLRLHPREERRLKAGHLWIFSNEIDNHATPLSTLSAGQLVHITTHSGQLLGTGYINPQTLLCARLLTRNSQEVINHDFFAKRLQQALQLRETLFKSPFYRLVYGESDGLPGLIIDRYDHYFVVQLNTAGMENLQQFIVAALQNLFKPAGILLRNDSSIRMLEGLPQKIEIATGTIPDQIMLEENNIQFYTSLTQGQKTGWFYDHRNNRMRSAKYVAEKRVLDLFSYAGAWGIQAAMHGAKQVVCVDSSASALELLQQNAVLNNVAAKIKSVQADVFDFLKSSVQEKQLFDIIILDPPAFIKKRKDTKVGFAAYQQLHKLALKCLTKNGVLISASCSLHLEPQQLLAAIHHAGITLQREIQILEQGHQDLDHPIHSAIPETAYLKAFFCKIS